MVIHLLAQRVAITFLGINLTPEQIGVSLLGIHMVNGAIVSTHSHRRGDAVHTFTLVIYIYLYDSSQGEKTCHASKSAGKGLFLLILYSLPFRLYLQIRGSSLSPPSEGKPFPDGVVHLCLDNQP